MTTPQGFISEKLPFIQPERLFRTLKERAYFIWLDTCLRGRSQKYSVIAFDPFLVFKSKGKRITVSGSGSEKKFCGDPFEALNSLLGKYRGDYPGFFSPGALGFFSYDLGWQIEKLPDKGVDDLELPDICLGFYDTVFLIDRREKCLTALSANLQGENERSFKSAFLEKTGLIKKIPADRSMHEEYSADIKKFSSNISYERYVRSIGKIKDYIANGDVYQINFAQRLEAEGVFSPEAVYTKIRKVNPTAYSGYFNAGNFLLLSNSPEIFLRKEGMKVMTKPMKGTRPRGMSRREDERYRKELTASAKDKAELVMIVDLERNDIGRVCRYGTVKVKKLQQVESYKTVFQTTALVEGALNGGVTSVDLLRATFPGGSITGAPKIRAMEIIEELEPNKRAFYTGSMGYLGFNGNMELNILIRTILLKGSRLYYPVGGGIVWDSSPEAEYEETMTKAKSLFLTLGCDYGKSPLDFPFVKGGRKHYIPSFNKGGSGRI
ncbi:MAG: aminodeoxychorismate synthase component I [Candidatus Omnitrophica bacterium]|nr:aminodeoxychorismate synthase component I [Candidatus Omnitrophota bacterium]